MKIGVLGTGMVGDAIASKLAALGHDVMMGSREAGNAKATAWAARAGSNASAGTFAEAAGFGEIVFHCTHGGTALEALGATGNALDGKILVDVSNITPPHAPGPTSLGESIQNAFPKARVVKALNTINAEMMVDPGKLAGTHTTFVSGNDAAAKSAVSELLTTFGWRDVFDLGGIETARGTEGYLTLWLALWKKLGTFTFNVNVVR